MVASKNRDEYAGLIKVSQVMEADGKAIENVFRLQSARIKLFAQIADRYKAL